MERFPGAPTLNTGGHSSRDGTSELEEIPRHQGDEPATEVRETYNALTYQAPTFLEVATTYRGSDADGMRYQLSQESLSDLLKTCVAYYAQLDPSIEPIGTIEVKDDPDSNTLMLMERYRIPDFWKEKQREFYAGQISEQLGRKPAANRNAPLAFGHNGSFTETIEARLPEHYSVSASSGTIATDSLDFRYSIGSSGNNLTLSYRLRQLNDHVPVDGLSKHSEAIAKIQKVLGYQLGRDTTGDINRGDSIAGYIVMAIVFGPFIVFGGVKLFRRRRLQTRRTEHKRCLKVSAGETPEMAIPVSSPSELNAQLLVFRCGCGAAYNITPDSIEHDSLMFDGRRISVVSLNCHRCAQRKDVYFAVSSATANH